MRQDAAEVWGAKYAADPDTAIIKLLLGHDAYQHSRNSATAVFTSAFSQLVDNLRRELDLGRLNPLFRELREHVDTGLKSSESTVLEALRARGEIDGAKSKLTAKGAAAEGDLVQQLLSNSGIASAARITTKDLRGKLGGDVIVKDHTGNGCVVELKDKGVLAQDDFTKFEEDAKAWEGPDVLFAFVRKDGAGSCRKLHAKPLFQRTPYGKVLCWFKGDAVEFIDRLPYIMACAAGMAAPAADAGGCAAALEAAIVALDASLEEVRAEIGALDKKKLVLQKRERSLVSDVGDAHAAVHCGPKKRRVDFGLENDVDRVGGLAQSVVCNSS